MKVNLDLYITLPIANIIIYSILIDSRRMYSAIKAESNFFLACFPQFSKKITASKQSLAADKFLYTHDIGNEAVSKVLETFFNIGVKDILK